MRRVEQDALDLWLVDQDQLTDPDLLAAYRQLLSPEEVDRHERFLFEVHRHQFLVARALVRGGLSRYADVDPRDWVFEAGPYGRPRIVGPAGVGPLDFNLSHTDGMIALAVGGDLVFGVDVEDTWRKGQTVEIADRFFSPSEAAALRAQPPAGRRRRFFDYWTLKEAYIKARGMGLHLPLDRFSYRLDDGPGIGIEFAPGLDDDPAAWQFAQFSPTARHLVGVAVRRDARPDIALRIAWTVPLVDR